MSCILVVTSLHFTKGEKNWDRCCGFCFYLKRSSNDYYMINRGSSYDLLARMQNPRFPIVDNFIIHYIIISLETP